MWMSSRSLQGGWQVHNIERLAHKYAKKVVSVRIVYLPLAIGKVIYHKTKERKSY